MYKDILDEKGVPGYEHVLFTSGLQFVNKRYHATNMCATMIRGVASYYNSRHTDAVWRTVNASKAFDHGPFRQIICFITLQGITTSGYSCVPHGMGSIRVLCYRKCGKARGHFIPYPLLCVRWWIVESPPLFWHRMTYFVFMLWICRGCQLTCAFCRCSSGYRHR